MEESRIAAEVTIYADKICVDEETVRLRSHIPNTRNELLSGGGVGRKLDFIAQEMNPGGQYHSVQVHGPVPSRTRPLPLRPGSEKVREQIQNIE